MSLLKKQILFEKTIMAWIAYSALSTIAFLFLFSLVIYFRLLALKEHPIGLWCMPVKYRTGLPSFLAGWTRNYYWNSGNNQIEQQAVIDAMGHVWLIAEPRGWLQ